MMLRELVAISFMALLLSVGQCFGDTQRVDGASQSAGGVSASNQSWTDGPRTSPGVTSALARATTDANRFGGMIAESFHFTSTLNSPDTWTAMYAQTRVWNATETDPQNQGDANGTSTMDVEGVNGSDLFVRIDGGLLAELTSPATMAAGGFEVRIDGVPIYFAAWVPGGWVFFAPGVPDYTGFVAQNHPGTGILADFIVPGGGPANVTILTTANLTNTVPASAAAPGTTDQMAIGVGAWVREAHAQDNVAPGADLR